MQFLLSVLLAVALQLGCAGLVLPKNLYQCAWGEVERGGGGLGVAPLGAHDVEHVGHEKGEQRVAGLDVSIATRKGNLGGGGLYSYLQGQCHLHSAQCMGLIFQGAAPFAGFDF